MYITTVVWPEFLSTENVVRVIEKIDEMAEDDLTDHDLIELMQVDRNTNTGKQTTKRFWPTLESAQQWAEFMNTFDPLPLSVQIDSE
jgi:hypothetical protein